MTTSLTSDPRTETALPPLIDWVSAEEDCSAPKPAPAAKRKARIEEHTMTEGDALSPKGLVDLAGLPPSAMFVKRVPIGFARLKKVLGLATDSAPMRLAMALVEASPAERRAFSRTTKPRQPVSIKIAARSATFKPLGQREEARKSTPNSIPTPKGNR